jgi:hypothetical protein
MAGARRRLKRRVGCIPDPCKYGVGFLSASGLLEQSPKLDFVRQTDLTPPRRRGSLVPCFSVLSIAAVRGQYG